MRLDDVKSSCLNVSESSCNKRVNGNIAAEFEIIGELVQEKLIFITVFELLLNILVE